MLLVPLIIAVVVIDVHRIQGRHLAILPRDEHLTLTSVDRRHRPRQDDGSVGVNGRVGICRVRGMIVRGYLEPQGVDVRQDDGGGGAVVHDPLGGLARRPGRRADVDVATVAVRRQEIPRVVPRRRRRRGSRPPRVHVQRAHPRPFLRHAEVHRVRNQVLRGRGLERGVLGRPGGILRGSIARRVGVLGGDAAVGGPYVAVGVVSREVPRSPRPRGVGSGSCRRVVAVDTARCRLGGSFGSNDVKRCDAAEDDEDGGDRQA
mmetsp:Transcript_16333/g.39082  ORF Transcript_16333/g.39082 Transcript_16333/m.39082 type:complete len:261 (-) Transcript_16333:54-836(-)